MTLTPIDIQNKKFERVFRGYSTEEVDEFLDHLARDLEIQIRDNLDLKDQLQQLEEKLKTYHQLEETMHNAILVAQEAAEEVKQNANREAELIRREAEREGQRILEDARYRASRILVVNEELRKQAQVFKMRFRSFMEAQLAAIELEEWTEPGEDKLGEGQ